MKSKNVKAKAVSHFLFIKNYKTFSQINLYKFTKIAYNVNMR